MTTTATSLMTADTDTERRSTRRSAPATIPLSRIVVVELRKSFDTRAGLWLLASIGLAALLTTAAVILFAPAEEFTYATFTMAISVPMTVILPIIAVLSVTAEWSQRSGLTTFTLVPHRGRIIAGKAVGLVMVSAAATLLAFVVGAVGNVAGAAIGGTDTVWDQDAAAPAYWVLSNTLLLLVGFTLGVLIRNSPGAIVAYFVYAFVVPPLLTLLAFNQEWFADLQPWVDPNYSQDALLSGGFSGGEWTQLAATTAAWLLVPLAVGVRSLLRSEVK